MSKEITSQDVLVAVKELANQVTEADDRNNRRMDTLDEKIESLDKCLSGKIDSLDKRLSGKIDSLDKRLSGRMDFLETRLDKMNTDIKQEFNKVNKKIDVIDGQLTILSGSLTKTQAEVKVLQDAK